MPINIVGYDCKKCGWWGDLLLGYGVLNGREEILGSDSEALINDKGFFLQTYFEGVEFRRRNSELTGIECHLKNYSSFEDLSLNLMGSFLSCSDCQKVYQRYYLTGKEMAITSLDK